MVCNNGVCMTAGYSILCRFFVWSAEICCSSDDVVVCVSFSNEIPNLLMIVIMMPPLSWWSIQSCDRSVHPSTLEMFVITIPFGKHLFSNRSPDRAISTSASVFILISVSAHWHPVVNDLGEWDSQRVHVHCIDTCWFNIVGYHDLIYSFWVLSKSTDRCHEPAITNLTLPDIFDWYWVYSIITPELFCRECRITDSLPSDVFWI